MYSDSNGTSSFQSSLWKSLKSVRLVTATWEYWFDWFSPLVEWRYFIPLPLGRAHLHPCFCLLVKLLRLKESLSYANDNGHFCSENAKTSPLSISGLIESEKFQRNILCLKFEFRFVFQKDILDFERGWEYEEEAGEGWSPLFPLRKPLRRPLEGNKSRISFRIGKGGEDERSFSV